MTNLLVWANRRMGLAFGMCGYPKVVGSRNSSQRIDWILVTTCMVVEGSQCDRNTGSWCGPTCLTPAVLAGYKQSFSDWTSKQELLVTFVLSIWTQRPYCSGFKWGLVNAQILLCLSHIIHKLSIVIVSTSCWVDTVLMSRYCSEDCMAS